MKEAGVQNDIRKESSRLDNWAWRNNNGACKAEDGRQIRYGLGNDSIQISKVFKSSDLIGITSHIVTPQDVGQRLGIFTAVEVKASNWQYSNSPHEQAQHAFLQTVVEAGGLAGFAASVENYLTIVSRSGQWQI